MRATTGDGWRAMSTMWVKCGVYMFRRVCRHVDMYTHVTTVCLTDPNSVVHMRKKAVAQILSGYTSHEHRYRFSSSRCPVPSLMLRWRALVLSIGRVLGDVFTQRRTSSSLPSVVVVRNLLDWLT